MTSSAYAGLITVVFALPGCAARSTVELISAENAYAAAMAAQADERAPYAWTLADAYMKKAREEYSYADYAAADRLCELTVQWSDKAVEVATATRAGAEALDDAVDIVPEEVDNTPQDDGPIIAPAEGEKLENLWEDDLEDEWDDDEVGP